MTEVNLPSTILEQKMLILKMQVGYFLTDIRAPDEESIDEKKKLFT